MPETTSTTRRQFMGAAVVGAGAALAAPPAVAAAAIPVPRRWDAEADVVVAGSGPTGLPAACAAVDGGASVIVLEQNTVVGGCGVIAGGILNIGGGTRVQTLNGITDSPDLLYRKLSSYKDPYVKRNDRALLRAFCDDNPLAFEWLEAHGVKFMDTLSPSGGTDALHRAVYHYLHWDKDPLGAGSLKSVSGAGLIRPLEAYARSKGVEILLEHKVTGIVRDNGGSGRVVGVAVQTPGGTKHVRARKAVILGTGSWKGHRFLRKLFDARLTEDLAATGEPFVDPDGSGIVAGLAAGGVLASDHAVDSALFRVKFATRRYNFPLNSPYGAPGLNIGGARRGDVIFVNRAGQRYVNEQDVFSLGTYSFFDASLAQEGHVIWAVFDDAAAKRNNWRLEPPVTEPGCAFSSATVGELAALIGVPADALAETVRTFNGHVAAGADPEFNRPANLLKTKIESGPFHAVSVRIFVHDTAGGLAVNAKAQVLDIRGTVIPGLYAGGEAAGGLDFIGLMRGIVLGRFAGTNAAVERPA
jgi:succinate dehydrogenase/fumarate reductase flavoprotein subunit